MIKKSISRTTFQAHLIDFVRDEIYEEAIKDDGIYSTFKLHNRCFTTGETRITLHYYKWEQYSSWEPIHKKIFYKDCPELGESFKRVSDRIKNDATKNDDAIWSTIKVEARHDHFLVKYAKANNLEAEIGLAELRNKVYAEAGIKAAEGPMTAQEMEIENTKRTLRRIQENSYYGLYPRNAATTYNFDEMLKDDSKVSLGIWKAKADLDIHSPSEELFFNYYNKQHTKEEKEKKDMNVTLMVVPEGMSKDFVNKVKANFQSNNSIRLFVASTDIDYICEHEPIKTKYDLFENWVKTGKVDVVYFMLGFEKDPDVRAFEAYVRGITEAEVPGKVNIRVAYQKEDIYDYASRLRTAYFDEADANKDLGKAFDRVTKEANMMRDIYGLDDEGLEAIKNSKGQIDASDGLVMGKIMDVAFAEDEDAKPAKKGGKND